jgi:hypothetical protein
MPRRRPKPDTEPLRAPIRFHRAIMHCRKCGYYFANLYELWNRQENLCTLCAPHAEPLEVAS